MSKLAASARRICDRYTLMEKLGSGGQGEVWSAHDETEQEDVAIKLVTAAFRPRGDALAALEREYAVVGPLDHPLILKIYPPLCAEGGAALPMKLATGGDLRQLRGASYLEIVPVLIELAQALEYAHEHGVVHRDLKPANVLFDARGRVQLADFGVAGWARSWAEADVEPGGWSASSVSPDHLRGHPPAPTDDIYGLGALAFELLCGRPPYFPDFDVRRVLEEPVPELAVAHCAPPRLLELVRAMLAKRPAQRPLDMHAVIVALDAAVDDILTQESRNLSDRMRQLWSSPAELPEC